MNHMGEEYSPRQANTIGIAKDRFKSGSGELKADGAAGLLGDLTGHTAKIVTIGTSSRLSGEQAQAEIGLLASSYAKGQEGDYFLIGRLSNGHFVNITGVDNDGNPILANTAHNSEAGGPRTLDQENARGAYLVELRVVTFE